MKLLQKVKRFSLSTVIIGFILGIAFIAFPDKCIQYISIMIGASFIATGIVAIIGCLIEKISGFSLASGILFCIVGIIICARYRQILSFIVIIIGLFIISAGIINLLAGVKFVATTLIFGWITMILSVAVIIFGLIAILNSGELTESLVQLIGAGLIVYSVLDLIAFFEIRSIVKNVKNAVKSNDVITEGEYIDE